MRRSRFFAGLVATALLLTACGGDTAETTTGEGPDGTESAQLPETEILDDTADQAQAADEDDMGDEETSETGTPAEGTIVVTVAGGAVDGPDRVDVSTGDTVTVMVSSDVSDEVHVHGVDATFVLTAGDPLEFDFVADVPGVFEVELENNGTLLFELAVR